MAQTIFEQNGVTAVNGALAVTGAATAATPAPADNSTQLATTAWVRSQSYTTGAPYLPLTGGTLSGNLGIGVAPSYLLHVKGATDTTEAVIAGVTKGMRFTTTPTTSAIEGVDQTGSASYQPLALGGSYVSLTNSGVEVVRVTGNAVGIGTQAPGAALHVAGSSTNFVTWIQNSHATAGDSALLVGSGANATTDATSALIGFYDGALGSFRGGIYRAGAGVAYNTTSDARLKADIKPTEQGLAELMRIEVRDYSFLDDPAHTRQGFIAQELVKVYPDAVHVGGDDVAKQPWMIDYSRLTPLLVRALQQQQGRIAMLEGRIAVLERG